MIYIAMKQNVEYKITEAEIPQFTSMGCTIYEVADNGYRVYKAPEGKEDLRNKVKELEAKVDELAKQIIFKDNQIVSLTAENTQLKQENQKLTAAAAVETATKKGGTKSSK